MSTSFVWPVPLADPILDGHLVQDVELCVEEALSPEWSLLTCNAFINEGNPTIGKEVFLSSWDYRELL